MYLKLEVDFAMDIWHLTLLYLIHPFYCKDVPNSSVEGGVDAGARGHPGGGRERVLGATKAAPGKYAEDPVNINRAVLFGANVFGKKTVANINNATVSAPTHWSAGWVPFRWDHTTWPLRCTHTEYWMTSCSLCQEPLRQTQARSSLSALNLPLVKVHELVDDTDDRSKPDCRAGGSTQTRELEAHRARSMTHNLVWQTGLSCLYTSAASGTVKRTAERKEAPDKMLECQTPGCSDFKSLKWCMRKHKQYKKIKNKKLADPKIMVWEPIWESIYSSPSEEWDFLFCHMWHYPGVQSQEDRDIDNTKTIRKIKHFETRKQGKVQTETTLSNHISIN